ncbi:hypothetical protein LGX04_09685, partial [Streptococcus mutans]|nr:hypothetical protein [Streptococcus mutans]
EIKKARATRKTADLKLSEMGGAIVTIEEPDRSLVMDSLEMTKDEDDNVNADAFLVYNVMIEPNLKDKELQKEFGCVEPIDIVETLFSPGTISSIATQAMRLAGYSDDAEVVESLKN